MGNLLNFNPNRDLNFASGRPLQFDPRRPLLFDPGRRLGFVPNRDLGFGRRGVVFRGYVCPICGALVTEDAKRCAECGTIFDPPPRAAEPPEPPHRRPPPKPKRGDVAPPAGWASSGAFCAFCGVRLKETDAFCWNCGRQTVGPGEGTKVPPQGKSVARSRSGSRGR